MPRKQTVATRTPPSSRKQKQKQKEKPSFSETPRGCADRMFRAAMECIRQRERYARLVGSGAHDNEQLSALRVAVVCDEILDEAVSAYEQHAAEPSHGDDEWRRQANALWHASREYRRRPSNDRATTSQAKGGGALQKLAMEYDLEASALLALKLALGGFRQICPDCELESRPQTFVA